MDRRRQFLQPRLRHYLDTRRLEDIETSPHPNVAERQWRPLKSRGRNFMRGSSPLSYRTERLIDIDFYVFSTAFLDVDILVLTSSGGYIGDLAVMLSLFINILN